MTVRGLVLKFEKPLSDKCEGLYPVRLQTFIMDRTAHIKLGRTQKQNTPLERANLISGPLVRVIHQSIAKRHLKIAIIIRFWMADELNGKALSVHHTKPYKNYNFPKRWHFMVLWSVTHPPNNPSKLSGQGNMRNLYFQLITEHQIYSKCEHATELQGMQVLKDGKGKTKLGFLFFLAVPVMLQSPVGLVV